MHVKGDESKMLFRVVVVNIVQCREWCDGVNM